jgi:hypothetical protein
MSLKRVNKIACDLMGGSEPKFAANARGNLLSLPYGDCCNLPQMAAGQGLANPGARGLALAPRPSPSVENPDNSVKLSGVNPAFELTLTWLMAGHQNAPAKGRSSFHATSIQSPF